MMDVAKKVAIVSGASGIQVRGVGMPLGLCKTFAIAC